MIGNADTKAESPSTKNQTNRFFKVLGKKLWFSFAPKSYIKDIYKKKLGDEIDLKSPETFHDKINWMKLYMNDPLLSICLDRFRVRTYIDSLGLGGILSNCYGVYPVFKWIDFNDMPEKFSLVATHGKGYRYNCVSEGSFDKDDCERKFSVWLRSDQSLKYGVKHYGYIKPRIMVEEYIDAKNDNSIREFSIMCFGGKAEYILFHGYKNGVKYNNVYDMNINPVPFAFTTSVPQENTVLRVPAHLEYMKRCAEIMSSPFPYARISFYDTPDRLIFSAVNFFDDVALGKALPAEFNNVLGQKLILPQKERFGLIRNAMRAFILSLGKKTDSEDNVQQEPVLNSDASSAAGEIRTAQNQSVQIQENLVQELQKERETVQEASGEYIADGVPESVQEYNPVQPAESIEHLEPVSDTAVADTSEGYEEIERDGIDEAQYEAEQAIPQSNEAQLPDRENDAAGMTVAVKKFVSAVKSSVVRVWKSVKRFFTPSSDENGEKTPSPFASICFRMYGRIKAIAGKVAAAVSGAAKKACSATSSFFKNKVKPNAARFAASVKKTFVKCVQQLKRLTKRLMENIKNMRKNGSDGQTDEKSAGAGTDSDENNLQ